MKNYKIVSSFGQMRRFTLKNYVKFLKASAEGNDELAHKLFYAAKVIGDLDINITDFKRDDFKEAYEDACKALKVK